LKQNDGLAPLRLNAGDALNVIRKISADSKNIVVVEHGRLRAAQRKFTRTEIERCLRRGTISEGPFMNVHGNWQVTLTGRSAGRNIHCVVAIDWAVRVIVITVF
jgi:hypothetical protein